MSDEEREAEEAYERKIEYQMWVLNGGLED